jgi:hypothetical protein
MCKNTVNLPKGIGSGFMTEWVRINRPPWINSKFNLPGWCGQKKTRGKLTLSNIETHSSNMIKPITQEQFKRYFTPTRGPKGSLMERVQSKAVETRWYQDDQTRRIGVIIFDSLDNDWQAITLEDSSAGYTTHEVRVSMPTETAAIGVLMELFQCETRETARLLDRLNAQAILAGGRSLEEVLLETPL